MDEKLDMVHIYIYIYIDCTYVNTYRHTHYSEAPDGPLSPMLFLCVPQWFLSQLAVSVILCLLCNSCFFAYCAVCVRKGVLGAFIWIQRPTLKVWWENEVSSLNSGSTDKTVFQSSKPWSHGKESCLLMALRTHTVSDERTYSEFRYSTGWCLSCE